MTGLFIIPPRMDETLLIHNIKDTRTREAAFRTLVDTYKERLYWQIRRMVVSHDDADDVLQQTFIKAWTGLDTFRGEARLSTWLYRIASNEALNHQARRKETTDIDDAVGLADDPYFDGDETQLQLHNAIATLPPKQRTVFNLKYFDEMKYEEMSETLGTSVGALKASYHHAVRKITAFFEAID